ncbi:MAG: hypothetical protein J6A04_07715 [Clostridia bacterium]|nr:hypothetical protein [Clostridia bacterium]
MEEEIKSINRNYNTLFIDNENEQEKLNSEIIAAFNTRDWNRLVKISERIPRAVLMINENELLYQLGQYTLENTQEQREDIINKINVNGLVKQINMVNKTGLNITLKDDTILICIKATEQIPLLKEDEKITTEDRYGICHSASKHYIDIFKDSKLVTGYVCGVIDTTRYLHSWIEFEEEQIEWVFDYTMNALINKNAYYKINHATKINEINEEEIYDDKRKKFQDKLKFEIKGEEHEFDDKTYLTCAQEIKKELKQKNPAIYKEIFEEER